MEQEENWLDPLKEAIKDGEEGPFIVDPSAKKVIVLGAGRRIGAGLLAELRKNDGFFLEMESGLGDSTKRMIEALKSKTDNLDCMAELGSPVEGKRLRSDGRRELMMNEAGTMTWPAPKPRRGRK